MFVELEDCGHVFDVNAMDRFMDESEAEEGQNGETEIKHKKCPKCSKLILSSRRYGKIIKQILVDFDAVKRQFLISDVADSGQIKKILNQVQGIREFRNNAEKIVQAITEGRVISEEITKRQNQVIFLKFLDAMYSLSKRNNDNALISKIHGLESRIMKAVHCFSEQEIVELVEELSRAKLLVCFKDLMTGLEQKSITLSPEDNACIISKQDALESGKEIRKYFTKSAFFGENPGYSRSGLGITEYTEYENVIFLAKRPGNYCICACASCVGMAAEKVSYSLEHKMLKYGQKYKFFGGFLDFPVCFIC